MTNPSLIVPPAPHACRYGVGTANLQNRVMDVAFREDDSGLHRDQVPHHYKAILYRIALNMLKQEKTAALGMAHKRRKAVWGRKCRDRLVQILLQEN